VKLFFKGLGMTIDRIAGRAVFADGVRPVEILIESGVVTSITDGVADSGDSVLIFPGFIDIHVHAREYPLPEDADSQAKTKWEAACRKETFATAGRAAINGGVTLYAAMPNDPIPPSNSSVYETKAALAASSPCPVIPFAAITRESEPWKDLPYKVYMEREPSGISFADWKDLESTLGRYRGCRTFFHAEDPEILARFNSPGPRWRTRPPDAEISAVERVLELTAKFGLRSHICHISTEKAVRLIEEYNRHGSARVTCEATPHHIFFSVNEAGVRSALGGPVPAADLLECNPPLRSEGDRRFLLEALREGLVDALATDHAPHTLEDKQNGAPGMPHLDTVGAFVGWLLKDCGFSPSRIAAVLSTEPGRIMARDQDIPHGVIGEGYAASFTLLDLEGTTIPGGGGFVLATRCGWSPFEGIALPARVRGIVIRGKEYGM
jgi:dihydroorotase